MRNIQNRIALALLVASCAFSLPEKWTFNTGALKFSHEFTDNSLEIKLEVPYTEISQSLALQFQTEQSKDCPSMVLYWDKQSKQNPSLSVAAGCLAGEKEPIMRWELVGDWQRIQDEVKSEVFHFHGKKVFKGLDEGKTLKSFGFGSFKTAKYISDSGKRITTEGPLISPI